MHEWIWRVKAMLGRKRMETEKAEEMRLHLEMEIDAGLRRELSLEEARHLARLKVGLVSEGIESTREEFGFRWLDGTANDFRHAIRALTRNRSFTSVAVLVLAASVAINTLIFCILEGVVLRPLPYQSPEKLVRLYDAGTTEPKFPMSLGHYLDYRANAKSLDSIALYTGRDKEFTVDAGASERLTGMTITSDFFKVLGKTPFLGRVFTEADTHNNVRNVILSHRFWRDRFHSDPSIVGKTIRLDRELWTVIGVAPIGFQHVGGDFRSPLQGDSVAIWMPLSLDGSERAIRAYHFCNAIAKVRDGFTEAQARQELTHLAALYEQRYPNFGKWSVRIEPLLNEVTGRSRQVVWLLVAAGMLVLLVACANIAGLCIARTVSRQKELSLRQALGANRWQLIRVGLAENLLIGIIGAVAGLLLAAFGLPLLHQLLPVDFPRAHEIGLTGFGAFFATAIAIVTMFVAGLLPTATGNAMQSHQRVSSSRDSRKLRTALVAGEIALAGLLCAGAIFLLRSYQELGDRDHGFRPEGALTFQISIPSGAGLKEGETGRRYDDIAMRIAQIPGVASVGATTNLPWSGYDENTGFDIAGRTFTDNNGPNARYQAASPGYFEAAGMRLLGGRFFGRARDVRGQPATAIVNDSLVKRYFPNENPVGATIDIGGESRKIVGVVADIKDSPSDLETKPAFWYPLGQVEFGTVFFAVRSASGDPAVLTNAVVEAAHSIDPELAVANIRTLERHASGALAARRFALWLFQAFAFLALILAAAGIYGLLAYLVQQRRKELGIRAALGASRAILAKMIFSDGLKMATAGAVCCLLLIPAGGFLLRRFLYNVGMFDFATVAGAPALLLLVALMASLGPALSATRSDPATALREE